MPISVIIFFYPEQNKKTDDRGRSAFVPVVSSTRIAKPPPKEVVKSLLDYSSLLPAMGAGKLFSPP